MAPPATRSQSALYGNSDKYRVWVVAVVLVLIGFGYLIKLNRATTHLPVSHAVPALEIAARAAALPPGEPVPPDTLLAWFLESDLYPDTSDVHGSAPSHAEAVRDSATTSPTPCAPTSCPATPHASALLALALFPDWMHYSIVDTTWVKLGAGATSTSAPVFEIEGVAVEVVPRAPSLEEEEESHLRHLQLQLLKHPRGLYGLLEADSASHHGTDATLIFKELLEFGAQDDNSPTTHFNRLPPPLKWHLENNRSSTVLVAGNTEYRVHYWAEEPTEGEVHAVKQHLQIQIRPWEGIP